MQMPVVGSQMAPRTPQSFGVPWHEPFMQASASVHMLLSSQVVPSSFFGPCEQLPLLGLQVPGSRHTSPGQTTGAPGWQLPPRHSSPVVHALLSLQAAPSLFAGFEHAPVCGSQVPAVWHWFDAVQTTGSLPTHAPCALHSSVCVQALPSLQVEPLGFGGFEHWPVPGSHTRVMWHWSGAGQVTGSPAVQTPAWHWSPVVQALPSLQGVPLRFGYVHMPVAGEQTPGPLQVPGAAQVTGLLPAHTPCALQASVCVQALLSLHAIPTSGVCVQPAVRLQPSAVQGLPSSQLTFGRWQAPAMHVPCV
jgi:hypothetical protein